jgi:short-subunit dehydrogenase
MFDKELLKGKSIIITGGGTGLGKSMATRFAELGANLVITSRRQEVIDSTAEELRKYGTKVLAITAM